MGKESAMKHRLPALDWLRGLVMILMASDHASGAFNAARPVTDSVYLYDPQQQLGAIEFIYRWLSHLCAPTFLFLAGTALALSIERKKKRGISASTIDRELLIRGLLIFGVDLIILNQAPITLAKRVLESHIVLIDRDPTVRHQFESLVMRKYFDFSILEKEILERRFING